jgi:Ca2+-binding RTX toxin-like protein
VEGSTPIMKDSTPMVNGSTPLIIDNKLKFTILALCSAVFTMSIANCLPEALAIPDIFDSPSLQASSIGDNVITCPPFSCTGTPEDDIMIGTAAGDTMLGLGGNDNIQGNGDADVIYGGDGGDNIQGGSKVDKIFGQDGNDYLFADSSTSLLGLAQSKVDVVNRSNDSIVALKTANISKEEVVPHNMEDRVDLFAQLNVDILALEESFVDGGKGDDHLYGGSGNDVFVGGPGHDVFDCGEGIDQVLDFNPKEDTLSTNCEII